MLGNGWSKFGFRLPLNEALATEVVCKYRTQNGSYYYHDQNRVDQRFVN
jgi:hypothetical protein